MTKKSDIKVSDYSLRPNVKGEKIMKTDRINETYCASDIIARNWGISFIYILSKKWIPQF